MSIRCCKLWLELGEKPIRWVNEDDDMNNMIRREPECHHGFSLEKAVCNHGFFMMAPNVWNPSTKTLSRPLRLACDSDSDDSDFESDSSSSSTPDHVYVSISQHELSRYLVVGTSRNGNNMAVSFLLVRVHDIDHLSSINRLYILEQVVRMLKLSEEDDKDVMEFQKLHPIAKQIGFGRLFRSPTIFEDAVKSILLCNCTWTRALQMADALCDLQLELTLNKKRRNCSKNHKSWRNFPIPEELADLSEKFLKERCNLGYRAFPIIELAREMSYGDLIISNNIYDQERLLLVNSKNQNQLQDEDSNYWYNKLMQLNGFGPFVCANVLMCMGFYSRIPVDTETHRHLSEYHSIDKTDIDVVVNINTIIQDIYGKYSPFQCLAYWLEMAEFYEKELGMKLSQLPKSKYGSVTGTLMGINHKFDSTHDEFMMQPKGKAKSKSNANVQKKKFKFKGWRNIKIKRQKKN